MAPSLRTRASVVKQANTQEKAVSQWPTQVQTRTEASSSSALVKHHTWMESTWSLGKLPPALTSSTRSRRRAQTQAQRSSRLRSQTVGPCRRRGILWDSGQHQHQHQQTVA